MSGPIKVIMVGKWSVGFSKSNNLAILSFEFEDHDPINLRRPAGSGRADRRRDLRTN